MSAGSLQDKVALISGGGRGIGAATAKLLAAHGARLVLVSRSQEELKKVVGEINGRHGRVALDSAGDVALESTWREAFQAASDAFGPVDILVNAAGVIKVAGLAATELETWRHTLGVNLTGSFLGCRAMLRQAEITGHGGCVVNISSLAGIRGALKFPGLSSYAVSKHGVIGLTEAAAVEGKTLGVRFNCVAPGAVDTAMLREAAPFLKTKTSPEDIAKVIFFFCDEAQSGKISGSVLEVFSNE